MSIFRGKPKLALAAIILVIISVSYLVFLFPYFFVVTAVALQVFALGWVLWIFAKMTSEDD